MKLKKSFLNLLFFTSSYTLASAPSQQKLPQDQKSQAENTSVTTQAKSLAPHISPNTPPLSKEEADKANLIKELRSFFLPEVACIIYDYSKKAQKKDPTSINHIDSSHHMNF